MVAQRCVEMVAKQDRVLVIEPSRQLVKRVMDVLMAETHAHVVSYEGKKNIPWEAFHILVVTPEAYLHLPRPSFALDTFGLLVLDHVRSV